MLRHQQKNRSFFLRQSAIVIILTVFSVLFFYADISARPATDSIELPEPVSGNGFVSITIETARGENPRRISQTAQRVEIWLGDKRLSSLNKGDGLVKDTENGRVFLFPEIVLPSGYYFFTVRCYGPAAIFGRTKWHGETFQVGVHPDKVARIIKKIDFFHW